jgi:hypothetical protein
MLQECLVTPPTTGTDPNAGGGGVENLAKNQMSNDGGNLVRNGGKNREGGYNEISV